VARLTTLRRERSPVRINVTVDALAEFHIAKARRPARFVRLVALFAGHLDVHPGQRIARLRVIKVLGRLPIVDVVAVLALISQLAFMRVCVAGKAILRQTKKSLRQVFVLNQWAQRRHDISGIVALLTCQPDMLAFERVARLLVVELLLRWIPVQQREICAVMFEVAADAILSVRIRHS